MCVLGSERVDLSVFYQFYMHQDDSAQGMPWILLANFDSISTGDFPRQKNMCVCDGQL